jgi:hypothetical protein
MYPQSVVIVPFLGIVSPWVLNVSLHPGEVMVPWNEPEVKPVARFINRSAVKLPCAQLRQASSRLLVGMVKFGNSVSAN